jgi:hypothetical protein
MAYSSRKPSIPYENIGTSSYGGEQRLALRPEDIFPGGVERRGPGGGLEEHISRPVPHKGWKYDYRTRRGQANRDPLEDFQIYPSGKISSDCLSMLCYSVLIERFPLDLACSEPWPTT